MSETEKKNSGKNVIGIVASVIFAIAAFLPLEVFDDNSVYSISESNDLIFVFIFVIATLVFSLKKFKSGITNTVALFGFGIADFMFALFYKNYTSEEVDVLLAVRSIGYYMLFIGAIGVILAGVYSIILNRKSE